MTAPKERYGRLLLETVLPDMRALHLMQERMLKFGAIPEGRTVYKWNGRWYLLPDPEKPA